MIPSKSKKEMSSSIYQAKSVLRKEMKKLLNSVTELRKQEQSFVLLKKVLNLDVYKKSKRISIFLPMSDEVNTLPILQSMFSDYKECFIPQYNKDEMIMVKLNSWEDYEKLPTTSWGIKQPSNFDPSKDALHSGGLDLIFMPGLAFTQSGARLGRGKGYYDKYLRKCLHCGKMPQTVALVFKEQLVTDIPVTEGDMNVDTVLYHSSENQEMI